MGGGEGAKDRRRLKRLQCQPTNPRKAQVAKGPSLSVPLVKTNSFKGKKANIQSKTDPSGTFEGPPANKEKKVKKPKHLKRKLEKISQDDEPAREIIMKELAQFEEIKSKLAQKSNRKPQKKVQKENYHNASKAKFTNDADGVGTECGRKNSVIDKPVVDNEATIINNRTEEDKNDEDSDVGEKSNNKSHEAPRRERGRRRRGRKDTAKQILEAQLDVDSAHIELVSASDKSQVFQTEEPQQMKGTEQRRYCIGRKPVTDFVLNQKYKGKVVYAMDFGVFFDIGCHSDAFCHVSRLSDDFVKNPHEMFKQGDEVEVRVVEIDRKQKRITVSLQSDQRIVDEKASLEARAQRKKNRNESRRKSTNDDSKGEASHDKKSRFDNNNASDHVSEQAIFGNGRTDIKAEHSNDPTPQILDKPISSLAKTATDEKRARKLARRAARRGQAA